MADFKVKVSADSSAALSELKKVGERLKGLAGEKKISIKVPSLQDLERGFKGLGDEINVAKRGVSQLYETTKRLPVIGEKLEAVEDVGKQLARIDIHAKKAAGGLKENAKAGNILSKSLKISGNSIQQLIGRIAELGFALFAVKEATGILKAAFGGLFNETIGRQIQLRETILKTQTALASTSKVFANGVEITEPYEKIVTLTSAVEKHIDNIRKRSIELAGVTSGEVIEVFGMVAQQVGQIGGGLAEAEDLAINFAAALGTFGIPLFQARQEIGSILRGDITMDSYLAKALGITNEDIAKAKTDVNGVMGFLEERLGAAVAGQRIAAEGFRGVTSNIAEIGEELNRNFGMGLLEPLLNGLTKVFDAVFSISNELWNASRAFGAGLGKIITAGVGSVGAGNNFIIELGQEIKNLALSAEQDIEKTTSALAQRVREFAQPVRDLMNELIKTVIQLGIGLKDLAVGFADISFESLKAAVATLASVASAFTAIATAVGGVLSSYGELLRLPIVQYFAQLNTTLLVLNKLGLTAIVKLALSAGLVVTKWKIAAQFIQGFVAKIGASLAALVSLIGSALTAIGTSLKAFAATIVSLSPLLANLSKELIKLSATFVTAGKTANQASAGVSGLAGATVTGVKAARGAIFAFIKFNAIILAVTLLIAALVERWNAWKQSQEDVRATERMNKALERRAELIKKNRDELTETERRELSAGNRALEEKYEKEIVKMNELMDTIEELQAARERTFRGGTAMMSGGTESIDKRIDEEYAKAAELEAEHQKTKALLDQERIKNNVRLEADKRTSLEKEIQALERQFINDNFNARMQLERTRIQLIQTENELLLAGIDNANAQRLRGEDDVAKRALQALNIYFRQKLAGEQSAQQREMQFQLEIQSVEKQIADYRFNIQKKINDMRKKAGLQELAVAQKKKELEEGTITQKQFLEFQKELREKNKRDIDNVGGNPENEALKRQALEIKKQIQEITKQITATRDIGAQGKLIEELFPLPSLQAVQNAIKRVTRELKVQRATGGIFDNEQLQLQIRLRREELELKNKLKLAEDAVAEQFLKGTITQQESIQLIEKINKGHDETLAKIKEQVKLQQTLNQLEKTQRLIGDLQGTERGAQDQIQDMRTRHRLELENVRQELIDAQIQKDQLQRRLDREMVGIKDPRIRAEITRNANLAMEAIDARARQAAEGNDPVLQLFKQYQEQINNTRGMIASLTSSITQELGSSMGQAVMELIEGAQNIQQVLGDMFRNIANMFLQMATQMIAKALVMKALGILIPVPGGGGFQGGYFDPTTGLGAAGPNYGFATGGIASGPETGYSAILHGREAVVPLPDGRTIPVDMQGNGAGPVNSTVNITISDSGTTVNRNQASELGRMVETSVMGILTRERRPGGILRS